MAIVNIQIPQIMSEIINILVKYTNEHRENNFFSQIKSPAGHLVVLYLAQVRRSTHYNIIYKDGRR